jgi:hypothetical protein
MKPQVTKILKNGALTLAFAAAAAGVVVAVVFGLHALNKYWQNDVKSHPAAAGASFLKRHGFTDIRGGSDPVIDNTCALGPGSMLHRTYTAKDKTGKPVKETVCFSPNGPYVR